MSAAIPIRATLLACRVLVALLLTFSGAVLTGQSARPDSVRILVNPVVVGVNMQVRGVGRLTSPAPAALDVTIDSLQPDVVRLSTKASAPGSRSVILRVAADQSALPVFFVQAFSGPGAAQLRVSAPGVGEAIVNVAVTRSAFVIAANGDEQSQPVSAITITKAARLSVSPVRLDPSGNVAAPAELRGGLSVTVPVETTKKDVADISSPIQLEGGVAARGDLQITPKHPGSTVVKLGTVNVEGFAVVRPAEVAITVEAPRIAFSMATLNVGANLQIEATCRLTAPAPTSGLVATIRSDNKAVALSTDPHADGSTTLEVKITPGYGVDGIGFPSFYVQALENSAGEVAHLTASAEGFTSATATITVTPSGFSLRGPNGVGREFAMLSSSKASRVEVVSQQLDPKTRFPAQMQALRGGSKFNLSVESDATQVAKIESLPIEMAGGNTAVVVPLIPMASGKATIKVVPPKGFAVPSDGGTLVINVN